MFLFGAIAATVWWKRGSGRVFGHWDELLRQMKGPLFAKAPSGEMPPLHSSSAPAPVPLQYLCILQYISCTSTAPLQYICSLRHLFCTFVLSSISSVPSFSQYPFCTFLLSRTSSVPLQSSSTIHCLLNSYCLKIREEKCLFFKAAVHHMYPFSTFILSSTSNHCLLYHNNSKLQILFTNQLGEMPSSEKPPSSKQHCTLIPSSTSPVPQFTITAQLL